jgi:acyl-CoA synthetase (AMP-forming)/AMP-acid ligase II
VIKQGYGMTEASPATHMSTDPPAPDKPGSVGVCVANTECKIIDGEGNELRPNEPGEICIRGPQVMKGYFNRQEATHQVLDEKGWLRTGDIGYADSDSHFFIVDRVKELIKYKGFQVAPAELEAVLVSHPMVADAVVIPSPDPVAGEVPKAFVVLKGDVPLESIQEYVATRVAPHKKIRKISRIDQIPKSPSGKILRRILIAQERNA